MMLEVKKLKKAYGSLQVLQGIDLEIAAGQILALLGPNGAGKTTLVSCSAGLRKPDSGEIYIDGTDALRQIEKVRPILGIAPQDLGFYPTLTLRENFRFFGELSGLYGKKLTNRIAEVAQALSLTDILNRPASELSGGQKRRLHTGLAFLHRPKLLFLDEPTVGADVRTRQEILAVVQQLAAEGCAICYCTHYMPEVEQLGAKIAILEGGQIIATGELTELVANHGTTALELIFNGEAPQIAGWSCKGSRARTTTPNPTATAASTLVQLGTVAERLRAIEIVQPNLESAYLALTGRRNLEKTSAEQEVTSDIAA